MKRILILFTFLFLLTHSALSAELNHFTDDKVDKKNISNLKKTETPKALLNNENYKLKGKIEFDEHGVLNLDDSDIGKMQLNIEPPKKHKPKSFLNEEDMFVKIENERKYKHPAVNEYLISPIYEGENHTVSKNFEYGTTFSAEMDMAQMEYRAKVYAQYNSKFINMMTGFGRDIYTSSGREMESIYFVPEIKLGHGFSVVDFFKLNPSFDRYRNDIILQYSPKIKHSRENVKLEAALGQINYYQTGEQFYQFTLSTKFKL